MELNQMDYNQISNLEAEYLTTNLREKINQELQSKLGLILNKDLNAKISWCALIYSWFKLYKKAEDSFELQLSQLESQRGRYLEEFKEIVGGKSDKLTAQSTKTLMSILERKYIENVQQKASKIVADKIAKLKPVFKKDKKKLVTDVDGVDKNADPKSVFDTLEVYKFLDNKYLNPQEYKEFLKYVHNPVKIFEDYVEALKTDKITNEIINPQSDIVQKEIKENLSTLLEILNKLENVIQSNEFQQNNKVENYFKIKKQNNYLEFFEQQQLMKFIFPVISYIMRLLLTGQFKKDEFEFEIYDDKQTKNSYIFQPKEKNEYGPLLLFIQTQNDIQQIINNKKISNQLVEQLIEILQQYQYENNCQMFQIDIIIKEMKIKAMEMQQVFQQKNGFNESWFGCLVSIRILKDTAIGCKSLCLFCGRKCELTQHQQDTEHTCDQMGHQMRVFKDAFFINDKGEKYPSLKTCDMIQPYSKIYIDDIKHTWQDILNGQAVKWRISYKADDKDFIQKYDSLIKFWSQIGKRYCQEKQFIFIENNDAIDKKPQMDESVIIAICIDMSGSMSGIRWNNAVQGAKKLIDYIKNNHFNKENVLLNIILFDENSKVQHDNKNLNEHIPENIWDPEYGDTNFGNPLRDAIKQISKNIQNKNQAKIYFFTDGIAYYPQEILDQIAIDIEGQKNNWEQPGGKFKLECLLMCENTQNATMELIKNKFNSISSNLFGHNDCCKLMEAVDTSKLGSVMIENFKFK